MIISARGLVAEGGELGKLDHRHFGHAELPRRQQPPMAGNDAVVAIDQHRVRPAELADRSCYLRHLPLRMCACVPGVRD